MDSTPSFGNVGGVLSAEHFGELISEMLAGSGYDKSRLRVERSPFNPHRPPARQEEDNDGQDGSHRLGSPIPTVHLFQQCRFSKSGSQAA